MAVKRSGLGRGLDSLFADNAADSGNTVTLKITEIEPNKEQPRKFFDEAALAELSDSIRKHGVVQPLLVRPMPNGIYQIVAGERRWRACRMAGLTEVPVVIRELSDHQTMEIALIENLQRRDLNPIEEAEGYRALMDRFDMTQEAIAESVGKSRPAITNALRLLKLPEPVLEMVSEGLLSSGHARALLSLPTPELMSSTADEIRRSGLSVRETEALCSRILSGDSSQKKKGPPKKERTFGADSFYREAEMALATELGKKVTVTASKDQGSLTIEFYSREEFSDLIRRLSSK